MSSYFPPPEQCSRHAIFPGVQIQTCAGEKMMLSVVGLAPHSAVEEHGHPHEQPGMVLGGRAIFFIGAEQKSLEPGHLYLIPGNTRPNVIALDHPLKAFAMFYP